jgi:hypothetical protein
MGFDACHPPHHDIHQDDIGFQRRKNVDRLLTAWYGADDLDVFSLIEQRGQAIAKQPVVINNQHFGFSGRRWSIHELFRFNFTVKIVPTAGVL